MKTKNTHETLKECRKALIIGGVPAMSAGEPGKPIPHLLIPQQYANLAMKTISEAGLACCVIAGEFCCAVKKIHK